MPNCLTCLLDAGHLAGRERCSANDVKISPGFQHYILNCLGPDIPGVFMVNLTYPVLLQEEDDDVDGGINVTSDGSSTGVLSSSQFSSVRLLDDNSELKSKVSALAMPQIEMLDIPVAAAAGAGDMKTLKAKMYKPTEFKASEQKKFPLVLHV